MVSGLSKKIPEWFSEKWGGILNLYEGDYGNLSSNCEKKLYVWEELEDDLREWLFSGKNEHRRLIMVTIGENGDIIRNVITKSGGAYLVATEQENETFS